MIPVVSPGTELEVGPGVGVSSVSLPAGWLTMAADAAEAARAESKACKTPARKVTEIRRMPRIMSGWGRRAGFMFQPSITETCVHPPERSIKNQKNPLGKRCFFNGGEGGIRIPSPIEAVKKSLSTLKKASKIMATGDNVCKTSSWIYLKRNGNKKS
jgi:hypothetical protein